MKKSAARGLAVLAGLGVMGGLVAAAAASQDKAKPAPGGAPQPPEQPGGSTPVDRRPPAPVPEPPPDAEEPEAPTPEPMPAPVSRAAAPKAQDEQEPPPATPKAKPLPPKPVSLKPPPKTPALPKGAPVIEVTSPKLRESTPAEKALAAQTKAKVAPAPAPVPVPVKPQAPPEPTAADYAAMHAEASQRAAAIPAPVKQLPPDLDRATARKLAPKVAANVQAKKYDYSRDLVRQFQKAAGIAVDGAYGPATMIAVQYYGVRRPPRALFKGGDGTMNPKPYPWAA